MSTRFVWDLVPFRFAYDVYLAWFASTVHSGSPLGKLRFKRELLKVVDGDENWYCTNSKANVRTSSRMTRPEPLVERYGLTSWRSDRKEHYRGLRRSAVTA
jgi:putative DNA primase/helicase